ncbi:response regulator transcription factor [Fulvivirga sp. M361]|uniref:response regulator transcription factor n=1 Tax=Fulvivirga sp. M361 TaxID=2594266 RepID=UPI00117B7F25|nr:response regulator transcription factor [Fulvivirga sp. M361]TRX48618.1 response regulator transcription factor [Fulvivirga sp. M361]
MIKVLIADDHQMFIDGLKSMLEEIDDVEVIGEATNGKEIVEMCKDTQADVVIMDVSMPEMDGIEATREILKKNSSIKVLGLSMHNDRNFISGLLKTGASGYILKNTGKDELVAALHMIESGENYIGKEVRNTLLDTFMKKERRFQVDDKLSQRESEVLESITLGLTTQEIAKKLFISKNTVETHRKNLLYKLGAKNTAELITKAYKKGLIQ